MDNVTSQNLTKVNSINDNIAHRKTAKRLRQVVISMQHFHCYFKSETLHYQPLSSNRKTLLFSPNMSPSPPIIFGYLHD